MSQQDVLECMVHMDPNGIHTTKEIAEYFREGSEPRVSNWLLKLYRRGLVDRWIDKSDIRPGRPRFFYCLTDLGRLLFSD